MKLKWIAAAMTIACLPLAAQVRILASNGVKAVMEELSPQCERVAGQKIAMEYATSTALQQKIEAGEGFDLAVMTSDVIDQLIKSGKLSAAGRGDVARAGIGVGIRKGAKRPDIRTAAAFKSTLTNAKTITYAGDGASRVFLEQAFKTMGIADAMGRKTILEQGSTRSTARVASGEAELVLTLVSEILPAPGVELLGPIPPEYQHYVSFAAAVSAKSGNGSPAAAVIKFLGSPAAGSVLKAKGMEAPR
jgi:molybdate transport system substrate-binding protein